MLQTVTYHATSKSKTVNNVVNQMMHGKIEGGGTDIWMNEKLHIPAVPPSYLQGCNIIDIRYYVMVSLFVRSFVRPFFLFLSFVRRSVRLKAMWRLFQVLLLEEVLRRTSGIISGISLVTLLILVSYINAYPYMSYVFYNFSSNEKKYIYSNMYTLSLTFYYLSWTDSIKPSLQFSFLNFGLVTLEGSTFYQNFSRYIFCLMSSCAYTRHMTTLNRKTRKIITFTLNVSLFFFYWLCRFVTASRLYVRFLLMKQ